LDLAGNTEMGVKDHFARERALMNGGWLHRLTLNEFAMLFCYEANADNDTSLSRPSGSLIAKHIGHKNTNHISRLRRKLAGYGLIEIVSHGGHGPLDFAVVKMLLPPSKQASLFSEAVPPTDGVLIDEAKPPKNDSYAPQIDEAKPPKNDSYAPQKRSSHNKAVLLSSTKSSTEGLGNCLPSDSGILPIIEQGESDPAGAIKSFYDCGFIGGWELSGLPPHLDDAEFRFRLAVHFLNLQQSGKTPTPISWRMRIGDLAKMDRDAAMDAVLHSTKNNYAGLHGSGKNGFSTKKSAMDQNMEMIERTLAEENKNG
jgi:hypothetical protein